MAQTTRRGFMTSTATGTFALAGAGGLMMGTPTDAADEATSLTPDQRRCKLVECLGGDWPEPPPLNPQLRASTRHDGYRIESLTYEVEPDDRVPALLLIPDGVSKNSPAPAVAVWHQHAGQYHFGKSEPAGLAGNPMHHTGAALARLGFVVLCPDALCFEERQDPDGKLDGMAYERFEFLRYVVNGKCMAWKNILDMRRAVDLLCERPEVDAQRIGCYGHSMGSTHTWLVGPHEPRLKALVGNCCLPTYAAIHDTKILHCFPNFVPGWLQYGDTPEIAALIAPRALHLNLGENDGGSPIGHARAGVERIARAYADLGSSDRFSYFIEQDAGHVLSDEMWSRTRAFLSRHLMSS